MLSCCLSLDWFFHHEVKCIKTLKNACFVLFLFLMLKAAKKAVGGVVIQWSPRVARCSLFPLVCHPSPPPWKDLKGKASKPCLKNYLSSAVLWQLFMRLSATWRCLAEKWKCSVRTLSWDRLWLAPDEILSVALAGRLFLFLPSLNLPRWKLLLVSTLGSLSSNLPVWFLQESESFMVELSTTRHVLWWSILRVGIWRLALSLWLLAGHITPNFRPLPASKEQRKGSSACVVPAGSWAQRLAKRGLPIA